MAVVGIPIYALQPDSFFDCVLPDMLEDNSPKVGIKKRMPIPGTENVMNPNPNPAHTVVTTINMPTALILPLALANDARIKKAPLAQGFKKICRDYLPPLLRA